MTSTNECGIHIDLQACNANPNDASTFFNPVMKICREFVLCAISAFQTNCAPQAYGTASPKLLCLDAFGATGIGSLQWRKHLPNSVLVFVNDRSEIAVQKIIKSSEQNGIVVSAVHLHGLPKTRDGSAEHMEAADSQSDVENCEPVLHIIQDDANVTMHRKQFHVIYLDPFGSTVQYLDAAFRNVYHGGLVILTSTDVASLYGKCPLVTSRNYSAHTVRTDYSKEMAVRIVLAEAARAAAKCNKGFDVVCCLAVEHFVQVAVRVKRGANHGNRVIAQIHRYLHCLICAQWALIQNSNNPSDKPYESLPCDCQQTTPGKTAVIVGPMWSGEIICPTFVEHMISHALRLNVSSRAVNIMNILIEESLCLQESRDNNKPERTIVKAIESHVGDPAIAVNDSSKQDNISIEHKVNLAVASSLNVTATVDTETPADVSNGVKKLGDSESKLDNNVTELYKNAATTETMGDKTKRKIVSDESRASKVKVVGVTPQKQPMPQFYFNLHKRQLKQVNLPRMEKVVQALQSAGYRASRTHFEAKAVRSNATLAQLRTVLAKHFSKQT